MTYSIETEYLEHKGGTKFYETVLIKEENGPGLLIKRWGAIALKNGGGQTKYDRGMHSIVTTERDKILREKTSAKSGYERAMKSGALHTWHGREITAAQLAGLSKHHYNAEVAAYLMDYFGMNGTAEVINEAPPAREPEKPIERGETWGSW